MRKLGKLLFSFRGGKAATSVTVIGGADGPTSIFLAGKVPDRSMIVTVAAVTVIVVLLLVLFLIRRRRHRK